MFPKTGALAVAVYVTADRVTFRTIMPVLTKPEISVKEISRKKMINPLFMSLVVGLVLIAFNIYPSNAVCETLTNVGVTCEYFALIYIGADIGRKAFRSVVKRPQAFLTVPVKLIISPIMVFFVLKTIGVLTDEELLIIMIFSMLPSMAALCMLAAQNRSDDEYATAELIVTTLCSMVTIPLAVKFIIRFI